MLRIALPIYGRVRCAIGPFSTFNSHMQLRTRRNTSTTSTAESKATKASTKRKADVNIHIKQEVEDAPHRTTRGSIKKEIKVEPTIDADIETNEDKEKQKKKPRHVRVVKRGADGTPEKWQDVLRGIQAMRASQIADVDVAGVEAIVDDGQFAPHVSRFHVLVSAMMSSQTKDPVNAAAMKRLVAHGLTVQDMLDIDEKELAALIRPVGFFNNKARYIKQVAQILTDKAAEAGSDIVDIPNKFEDLVALPGVGPKMAHLVMSCAWGNTVGICVDTHVHRISNRLGWVTTWNKKNPKAQDPEKTRKELEDWLPREHWNPINVTLVGFGQTVCLPRGPKCSECTINHLCPCAFSSAI